MSKGSLTFKESDVTRAVRAVTKAGADAVIEFDLGNGKVMRITVKASKAGNGATEGNDWDSLYDQN